MCGPPSDHLAPTVGVALHLVVGLIWVHGGPKVVQILPSCAVNRVLGSSGAIVLQESDLAVYKIGAFFKHTPKKIGQYG